MEAISRPNESPVEEGAVEQVMNGIRSIVRALRLETRAIERELGVSLAQLWVLQILNQRPVKTLSELAAATATHQSSVSVVVRRLVQAGLVVRTSGVLDKRQRSVEITDAGRRLVERAPRTVTSELLAALRGMTPERRQRLAASMTEWLRSAGLEVDGASPMLMED